VFNKWVRGTLLTKSAMSEGGEALKGNKGKLRSICSKVITAEEAWGVQNFGKQEKKGELLGKNVHSPVKKLQQTDLYISQKKYRGGFFMGEGASAGGRKTLPKRKENVQKREQQRDPT